MALSPPRYIVCTPQFWPRHDGNRTDADVDTNVYQAFSFFPRSQHRREGLLSGAKLTCEWAQDLAGALGVK
jgi:hypothetical protein